MAHKNDGLMVVVMIIALIAFCIGAGIGIVMNISGDENVENSNNTTHYQNVTVEMTSNLNDSNQVDDNNSVMVYDAEKDNATNLDYGDSNINYSN